MLDGDLKIAVIGLGYVGLPVAVAFAKKYSTLGFDINHERLNGLRQYKDFNSEVSAEELRAATNLSFTSEVEDLRQCDVFIITVPTPIDAFNNPDFGPLVSASRLVGSVLGADKQRLVVYESTVYPGAVEEVCVPILEEVSGLVFNEGFIVGYSPERINPGDKQRRLETIMKVTSGSTPAAADLVDRLYASVIEAGTFRASSIKVAEAAKVIENTQRDLNIALINELAIIFNKLGIDTQEVLAAAGTKWNFLPFKPGLVGGHCIGVDPYYLTHKAHEVGYHPQVILAGRRINDGMGKYVAGEVVKKMLLRKIHVADSKILILGFAFKENCSDSRNTRVIDVVRELQSYGVQVSVFDPVVDGKHVQHEYGLQLESKLQEGCYDAIVIAVAHKEFVEMGSQSIRRLGKEQHVVYDVKHLLPAEEVDGRL